MSHNSPQTTPEREQTHEDGHEQEAQDADEDLPGETPTIAPEDGTFTIEIDPADAPRREAYPLSDLTGFQRDLLTEVAAQDSPHGLGIKAALDEVYTDEIHHGRLYPNLDSLVHKGLVKKESADKRTNVYRITPRGRREIVADIRWAKRAVESDE